MYRSRQSAVVIDAVGIRISSGRGNRESLCVRLRNALHELAKFPLVFTFENTEVKICGVLGRVQGPANNSTDERHL